MWCDLSLRTAKTDVEMIERRLKAAHTPPAQEHASGRLRNRRRQIWEVESPSAKVADLDKFRCSGVPFRQAMSLRLGPKSKFIIGAETGDDLRLRWELCVGKHRGSRGRIHILRWLV